MLSLRTVIFRENSYFSYKTFFKRQAERHLPLLPGRGGNDESLNLRMRCSLSQKAAISLLLEKEFLTPAEVKNAVSKDVSGF